MIFRSSLDDLLVHPFMKYPKKISSDPHALADEMRQMLGRDSREEKTNEETHLGQFIESSNTSNNPLTLSWEF